MLPIFSDSLQYQSSLPPALLTLDSATLPALLAIDRLITGCLQGLLASKPSEPNERIVADQYGLMLSTSEDLRAS